ncbi:MAG: diaminopimelate epimerase [Gracilibacteraceae bacterium]|jgi:diaminopimelate epimerase|nr:diaminopimelate epimerase [Gracilibacteraceae bacterium]
MDFIKMHGLCNDFILVDEFENLRGLSYVDAARRLCDRHRGIGGDGLLVLQSARQADVRMRVFNADGSEAEMCGNGIRCIAKYAYEAGYVSQNIMTVETGAGIKNVWLAVENGVAQEVCVDMGAPILKAELVPVLAKQELAVEERIEAEGRVFSFTAVSMGNPHCVIFVPSVQEIPLEIVGPVLEHHPRFPNRANVGFAQITSRNEIILRMWERGAGATLACGTGACAAVVAGVLEGRLEREAFVHLPGGTLRVAWQDAGEVLMSGPAAYVFQGKVLETVCD